MCSVAPPHSLRCRCSDLLCKADPSTAGCPCSDPVQGPTEVDRYSQADTGLTDKDIADLTLAWNETMGAVQRSLLSKRKYTWSLIYGQANANADPTLLERATCAGQLREATLPGSRWERYANIVGLKVNASNAFVQLEQVLILP